MVSLTSALPACALLLSLAPSALAQTSGRIIGTVLDQTGGSIAGASVVLTSAATDDQKTSTSDTGGRYSFLLVTPGEYTLTASAPGFQRKTVEKVIANVTETTIIPISLQLGDVQDSVTVKGDAGLLQTAGPQLGRVVDARGVSRLPLATRNFTQLLSLSPGTATYLPDSSGVGRNTQAISVNGARVTQNNYQMNGIDVNTMGTNGPIILPAPAPESIQEFKVQTSLYDATSGRAGGANIQILTRSGTNQLQATVYEYWRNDALNSNDTFLKAAGVRRPVLRRNVFGVTLGGPARQDRAFVFGSYQGSRETNGASLINSISSNVLVAPGLTNDRSEATLLATFHPVMRDGSPASEIHPTALALLESRLPNGAFLIPTPSPTGQFTASSSSLFREDQFNINFDLIPGPRDSFSAKVFLSNISQNLALPSFRGTGANVPGFGSDGIFGNRTVALRYAHAFSASSVNEVRLGYSLNRINVRPREPITDAQVGIARANGAQYPGIPLIRIAPASGGVTFGTGPLADSQSAPATTTLNDTFSIVRGRHTIHAGAEIRYNLSNIYGLPLARGQIDFQDFNSFLIGNARATTIGNGLSGRSWRAFDCDFFAQNDWKIASWLTVNLGIRYELDSPVYESRGRLSTFDPALYQPGNLVNASGTVGPPVGGLVQAGNVIPQFDTLDVPNGEPSLLRSVSHRTFAPRLGFAMEMIKGAAIRGGYGLFYSRPTFQYAAQSSLPPYYVFGVQSNAPLDDPFLPLPPSQQFPTLVPGVDLVGTAFDRNQREPYFHQFNLTTQFQIFQNWLLDAGYVGSRGRRLFRQVAINQALLASPQATITNSVTGAILTMNNPGNAPLRAPLQGVSINGFSLNKSDAESSYDSLQVSLHRRFAQRLQLLGSYTLARSIDDASGLGGGAGVSGVANPGSLGDTGGVLGNQLERRANRGVSDFSRTHRLVVSYVWDLPVPRFANRAPILRHVFSNWSASGILTAMSGLPVDIVDTGAGSLYGLANGSAPLARPSFAPGATCQTAKENIPAGYFFNPFAFSSPVVLAGQSIPSSSGGATADARGTDIGDVGRNCLRGPRQTNFDFAATRSFRWREPRAVEFRAEFFNLFNHANLGNPISNLNAVNSSGGSMNPDTGRVLQAGNFGRIISTSSNPRLVQFALRIQF